MKIASVLNFFLGVVIVISMKCSTKEEKRTVHHQNGIIVPIVENRNDTLLNGSNYVSKVYLSSDSLYRVAKARGIQNYLTIRFEIQPDTGNWFIQPTQVPKMHGDTAIVRFNASVPSLNPSEIHEYYWIAKIYVNFKANEDQIDTIFSIRNRIYLKEN